MARKDRFGSQRLVLHTSASRRDLISIYLYNSTSYGELHADRYLRFLEDEMARLAKRPELGKHVQDFPGISVHVAKVTPKRTAHGHRIFFREVDMGIEIIRILHTAMNWPSWLD